MKIRNFYLIVMLLAAVPALAGPPFFTDDPEPVDYHHAEINGFSFLTAATSGAILQPLFEANFGGLPDVQFHFNIPYNFVLPAGGGTLNGLGDAETGVKFRFLRADQGTFQMAVYPLAELPTGDSARGLGNGRVWWKFPFWVQKTWGPWMTYGGGGYAVNSAPGALNYLFGGWFLQYAFSDKLSLGGEIYGQQAGAQTDEGWIIWNLGGTYQLDWLGCGLLFSAGHNFVGKSLTVGFLGLSWDVDFTKGK